MARLTKIEKETIVLFNEGEDKANIYTHNEIGRASCRERV